MYAIVDIETTGGYASANGITEISIHVIDEDKLIEKFETLVNPQQPIPRYIQAFTGITDAMVTEAPAFSEVAEKVYSLLEGNVFVAHNVNFDYSFIREHLAVEGYTLQCRKLCTVRLARRIFPGLPSYSLGRLCQSLAVPMNGQHRAGVDVEATVKLFRLMLQNDREQYIQKSLRRDSKEQVLPPNVPKEHFEQLPYTPGIYYFHNAKGKVIYVGKAKNLRYRVNSHFSNNSPGRQKQNFLRYTHAISYTSCATELMASILESTEIRKLWPEFNYAQKRQEQRFGIFRFEDQNGYARLFIEKVRKQTTPAYTFNYLVDGHAALRRLMRDYRLCPKLCFLQTDEGPCQGKAEDHCTGACEGLEAVTQYNERVENALRSLQQNASFAIIEDGRTRAERSCILVWKGQFYGMGYLQEDIPVTSPDEIREYLTPYHESSYIRNLIRAYAEQNPSRIVKF